LGPYQGIGVAFDDTLQAGYERTPDKSAELPDIAHLFAKFIYCDSYHRVSEYNGKKQEDLRTYETGPFALIIIAKLAHLPEYKIALFYEWSILNTNLRLCL
jgi:hypothetical protein